jgi:cellulose synthase/poly-beta-1,6-N-acetylglucosamine synthase-like glycosyltransferase
MVDGVSFYLILRIIEKVLVIYFSLYLLIDLGLFFYALLIFSARKKRYSEKKADYEQHFISLLVPAYNEGVSIVSCLKMLLQIEYPAFEVVVINDGSKDHTMEVLLENFELKEVREGPSARLTTEKVKKIYQDEKRPLKVIDKENGGKADGINAGINYARGSYICTIDADSILDPHSLTEVVTPFITDSRTMVSGGQLAASNGLSLQGNRVVSAKTPSNIWVIWQIIEYIKSFMISRIGLSRINALLIMSGAFSLYRKDELLAVGGFLTRRNAHPYIIKSIGEGHHTVCEDMEIVIRLSRYRRDRKKAGKAVFLPRPVCWTEVPDNGRNLFRQRSRWHQGLAESLYLHRKIILEPSMGMTGLVGLPYYFFFEMMAPIVKVFSLGFILLSAFLGTINTQWVLLLLISVILLTAIIMSLITAMVEYWSYRQSSTNRDALRYKSFRDWIWFIFAGILGEFSYSFYKIVAQLSGFVSFFRGKSDWKKFERKGLNVE